MSKQVPAWLTKEGHAVFHPRLGSIERLGLVQAEVTQFDGDDVVEALEYIVDIHGPEMTYSRYVLQALGIQETDERLPNVLRLGGYMDSDKLADGTDEYVECACITGHVLDVWGVLDAVAPLILHTRTFGTLVATAPSMSRTMDFREAGLNLTLLADTYLRLAMTKNDNNMRWGMILEDIKRAWTYRK